MMNGLIRLTPYASKFQELTANVFAAFERELKQTLVKIGKSHNRQFLRDVLNNINEAVLILDKHGRVIDINNKALSLFAAKPRDILARLLFSDLLSEHCAGVALQQDFSALSENQELLIECKARQLDTGCYFDAEVFVKNIPAEDEVLILATVKDISKHKQREETLRFLATTDELTGINNRRQFLTLLNKEVVRSKRYDHLLSLLMIDVDYFKQVNDRYGHDVGDQVLKDLVNILSPELRDIDVFGRLGGEEFCIVLPETGADHAQQVAERLRKRVAEHEIILGENSFSITVSLGVATARGAAIDADGLLKGADIALYRAKHSGRNRVEFGLATETS